MRIADSCQSGPNPPNQWQIFTFLKHCYVIGFINPAPAPCFGKQKVLWSLATKKSLLMGVFVIVTKRLGRLFGALPGLTPMTMMCQCNNGDTKSMIHFIHQVLVFCAKLYNHIPVIKIISVYLRLHYFVDSVETVPRLVTMMQTGKKPLHLINSTAQPGLAHNFVIHSLCLIRDEEWRRSGTVLDLVLTIDIIYKVTQCIQSKPSPAQSSILLTLATLA